MRERMDRYKGAGIAIINMMIGGIDDVIWGRPGLMRRSRTLLSRSEWQVKSDYR